jgi:tetraacyldisaccharide 4'-kinase
MGGTGKTPQVEYLIRLLKNNYKLATLSRGYKRKTKGFIIAGPEHSADMIGDEPLQYSTNFPDITVAVDEKRVRGINNLLREIPDLDIILLDDAFQHRKVKPGLSILLTDYHKPWYTDYIFPAGTLREPRCEMKRADIIIVTKTPKIFSPIIRRDILEKIKPADHQSLYFSFIKYGEPTPLCKNTPPIELKNIHTIVMLAGIANPDPMEIYLHEHCDELITLTFPDHHDFSGKDLQMLRDTFINVLSKSKIIITTGKDAMRLSNARLTRQLEDLPVYILPVETLFHHDEGEIFNKQITDYVTRNKRNH